MTNITFVAPYPESINVINDMLANTEIPKSVNFNVFHLVGSENAMKIDWSSDIVIARGLTYNTLKANLKNVQLIEIAVTGYDILKAVQKAIETYNPKKVAIVLANGIEVDVNFIKKIFKIDVSFFSVSNEHGVEEIYNFIKNSGEFDAIVGGLTVYKYAKVDNFNAVRVHTGNEAIKMAIQEAITAVNVTHRERRRTQLLTTMVETLEEGIIAIDSENNIYTLNDVAKRMFGITETNIIGQKIENYIPAKVIVNNYENYDDAIIKKVNNNQILIKYRPLIVDGINDGLIIILTYIDDLQKTEIDVRKKLSKKGLTAKYNFEDIVGSSATLQRTKTVAEKYASTDSDVLIIGETGTGKELFAQSIHNNSKRMNQPFVALNCAAINENLLESELFGYTEGSFTGAVKGGRIGLFELAHKGTLFMDEIAELPLSLQAKLLRVLQEKEIRKLGDDKIIPVDVRIIAATNVNLHEMVEDGKFRQDLLYRLDILNLAIPPLRAREEDVECLSKQFISKYDFNGMPIEIQNNAVEMLKQYKWKGNIRELRNICERLCVLNTTGVITTENVREVLYVNFDSKQIFADDINYFSKNEKTKQKKEKKEEENMEDLQRKPTMDELAKQMGISRTTLWRRLKRDKN